MGAFINDVLPEQAAATSARRPSAGMTEPDGAGGAPLTAGRPSVRHGHAPPRASGRLPVGST